MVDHDCLVGVQRAQSFQPRKLASRGISCLQTLGHSCFVLSCESHRQNNSQWYGNTKRKWLDVRFPIDSQWFITPIIQKWFDDACNFIYCRFLKDTNAACFSTGLIMEQSLTRHRWHSGVHADDARSGCRAHREKGLARNDGTREERG